MERRRLSIGIAAAAGADVAGRIAPLLEDAGLGALWVNETPGANALDVAGAAAGVTRTLRVATGVIPVDRRPADEVLADLARLDIPADRLTLGIGSGARRTGALDLMRGAIEDLRAGGAPAIALGALGPKMRRLAAERAEAVVLNWLTPATAADQAAKHHAVDAGGRVVLYVRTATRAEAVPRLEAEAARYGGFPSYAANFARLGFGPLDTAIRPGEARERVAAFLDAVDEVVLRAVTPGDDPDDYVRFVEDVIAAIR